MIRARELNGRAVVDMEAAEKLGRLDDLVLDLDGRRVAALMVSHGDSVIGGGTHLTIPAAAVHAIGPDAITVRRAIGEPDMSVLDPLPRLSKFTGRKVVSQSGRLLGRVGDVLIEEEGCRIFGYTITDHTGAAGKLESLFGGRKDVTQYLRADANLKPGRDLIVAPDDAVLTMGRASNADDREASPGGHVDRATTAVPTSGTARWEESAPQIGGSQPWTRRDDLGLDPEEPIR